MRNTKEQKLRFRKAVVTCAGLLMLGARPAMGATPDQVCQFQKLKAEALEIKKTSSCWAKYLKTPSADPTACINAAIASFGAKIAKVEAAGGCRIENQRNALFDHLVVSFEQFLLADVVPTERYVFVTSTGTTGGFGSQGNGDYICAQSAQAAGLPVYYHWKAWLSGSAGVPATEFSHPATVPYKLLDGTVVANSWADLTDGSLLNPINVDENGNVVTSTLFVWTGTTPSGNASPANCLDWTSNSASDVSTGGGLDQTDNDWTDQGGSVCLAAGRLYCVQQ